MNSCGVQQSSEMMTSSGVSDHRNAVVCPKPRRICVSNHHRSLRWQVSHQIDLLDSNSVSEILDFLACEQEPTRTVPSSESLPLRVSNPLTKDSIFRDQLLMASPPSTPREIKLQPLPSSPINGGNGGCVRTTNFGNKPAIRVVGFNCLDRDRRSISTLA